MVFARRVFTRLQRFYSSIKLLADLATLTLAFGAAYLTRFSLFPFETLPPASDTLETLALILVIFPLTYRQTSLYTTNRNRTHITEVFDLFRATVMGLLILVAVSYFVRERYSRGTIIIFAGYAFLAEAAVRLAIRVASNEMRRRGFNRKSILVVGAGDLGRRVLDTIEHHQELGFAVAGFLTRHTHKVGQVIHGVPVLGLYDELGRVLDEHPVDQVMLALPMEEHGRVKGLMEELALRTVDVKVVPDLFSFITLRGGLEEFGGLPIISLQGAPLEGWNVVLKRAFDVIFSVVLLVLFAPVMVLVALAVALTSRGPVLYAQERMGIDGRLFRMVKFRTMRVDAEVGGARFASKGDERCTPVGLLLRRLSLDELPQLFNVLKGEMSLVGPRPERPVFIDEFKRQIPRYHLRHLVKSGLTGWAQVNGLRGDTSIAERIEYDLYYIENWSLLFDLKILLRTALGGFLSRNAY